MRLLIITALLVAPSLGNADPAPDAGAMHTGDCARARAQHKTCVLDMGKGDEIDGTAPTAGGSAVSLVDFGRARSLVRIRRDFIVEILRTAEDL